MAAAAVHPLPTSPPPRRVVAPLVRNRLAAAPAGAVICLFLTSLWLLYGSLLTVEIGQLACGEGCPVVFAATKVLVVAAVILALVAPFILLALMLMVRTAGVATDIEAAKELKQAPAPKTFAAVAREQLRDRFMQAFLASTLFVLLLAVGVLLKDTSPVKGSLQERMGSVIFEVGALGVYMVNFFVVCPILTVSMWRAWRMLLQC